MSIRPQLIVVLLIGFCSAALSAETAERDAKGDRIWQITDYLKGTSWHIHDLLTAELHRLNGKIQDTEKAIVAEKAALESDSQPIITAYLQRSEYLRAKADVVTYKQALDKAHADHDSAAALEAGSQYNKTRELVTKLEKAANAAADDTDAVKTDRTRLANDQGNLIRLQAAREKATQWHDELVAAIHNSFMLQWPLVESKSGTLGEIVPSEIDKSGNITCNFDVREDLGVKDAGEGFVKVRQRIHPVRLIIQNTNLKPGDAMVGKPMRFDRNVEILSSTVIPGDAMEATIIVQVKHADVDDLMDAVAQP